MNTESGKSWVSPKVEIKASSIEGDGMFAKEPISEGEKVLVWTGPYVGKKEAEEARKQGKLVMQYDENMFTIEDRKEDEGYFLNHSCDPNVWMDGPVTLTAMRGIKSGEELTADYAMFEADENKVSKWKCRCGKPNCRGRVTGHDWENKELQNRYRGHFTPLLNKRIEKNL